VAHLVLSRKYRPQRFEDLVGQEHVAQTLSNAITSGRIGHAYLFVGPRGTGKTTTARIFAKALNCASGPTPTPCGTCDSCVAVTQGNDLDVVEMDAASNNGVDDVRALRDSVGYRPARSRFRVWIVDEVHMLSLPAFNAFLKTLEEPPAQAKFLFCTTEAHKLPETFTSRVQRLEFRRIDEAKMADRLRALAAREALVVEDGVCDRIASGALGGLRDAESLLEQLLSAAQDGRVTLADLDAVTGRSPAERLAAVFEAPLAGDAGAALDPAGACIDGGGKPDTVLEQWVEALRAYLGARARARTVARARRTRSRGREARPCRRRRAADGPPAHRAEHRPPAREAPVLREGADGRLVVEVAAVELARPPSARDLDALVDALRSGAASGAGAAPAATAGSSGGSAAAGGTAGGTAGGMAARVAPTFERTGGGRRRRPVPALRGPRRRSARAAPPGPCRRRRTGSGGRRLGGGAAGLASRRVDCSPGSRTWSRGGPTSSRRRAATAACRPR
jgi:DNA polymerase-3 subunit gamma/tau